MENLYELLEEAAHKVPTKGIVIVNNSQCDLFLTYSELREKSRKIAFILKSYYQVKPVSKIIISVEKSENFILLFWGQGRRIKMRCPVKVLTGIFHPILLSAF